MDTRGRGARRLRLVAAVIVPLLLMVGTLLAEALQPPGFDPLDATLSDMAGLDAAHREVMTIVIIAMGVWFAMIAWWLTVVATAGRIMLAAGGAACLGVVASPVSQEVIPIRHFVFAALAFMALSLWPVVGMRRSADAPWPLRPAAAVLVTAVLCGLFIWFTLSVSRESGMGLPEHILAVIQVTWPTVVAVASARSSARRPPSGSEAIEYSRVQEPATLS